MKIRIEPVTSLEQEAAAAWVRRQVFGTEWATELCRIAPDERPRASQLIARVLPDDEVVATLTLIGTTGNHALHDKYELPFNGADRVGRYTQMAVLKPYRGLNLPLYLLLEARRLFVVGNFTHTWLLFRADRAITSRFCRMLDFSASSHIVILPTCKPGVFWTKYGRNNCRLFRLPKPAERTLYSRIFRSAPGDLFARTNGSRIRSSRGLRELRGWARTIFDTTEYGV